MLKRVVTFLAGAPLLLAPVGAQAAPTEIDLDLIGPRFLGTQYQDNLGWEIQAPGDVNGDGRPDFAVSAPQDGGPVTFDSTLRLYFGRDEPVPEQGNAGWADVTITDGKTGGDAIYQFKFIPDANGDGEPDLLVVEPRAGAAGKVLLFPGQGSAWPESLGAPQATARWDGYLQTENGDLDDETRPSLATGGDLDGDGLSDIIIASGVFQRVWIDYSSNGFAASSSLEDADAAITLCSAEIPGADFAQEIVVGDLDNDGDDELVVAAPGCGEDTGRVYVWYGGDGPISAEPDVTLAGGDRLGGALHILDLDDDGFNDLFVQELRSGSVTPTDQDRGNLWIYLGSAVGINPEPKLRILASFSDKRFGESVAMMPDISQPPDGLPELVVGAPEAAFDGTGQGAVYVFEGLEDWGTPNELTSDDARYRVTGAHRDAWFGAALAVTSDFDGDGHPEIIIGEPNYTEGDSENDFQRGRFYMLNVLPDRDEDDDGIGTLAGDCNDLDATIRPGVPEECDGTDNDCDNDVDEGCGDDDDDDDVAADDDDDDVAADDDDTGLGGGGDCGCEGSLAAGGAGAAGLSALLAMLGLGMLRRRVR